MRPVPVCFPTTLDLASYEGPLGTRELSTLWATMAFQSYEDDYAEVASELRQHIKRVHNDPLTSG
eukprot:COSAG01_NODE_542_length_15693_cov_13.246253_23_plen_64_part_01